MEIGRPAARSCAAGKGGGLSTTEQAQKNAEKSEFSVQSSSLLPQQLPQPNGYCHALTGIWPHAATVLHVQVGDQLTHPIKLAKMTVAQAIGKATDAARGRGDMFGWRYNL